MYVCMYGITAKPLVWSNRNQNPGKENSTKTQTLTLELFQYENPSAQQSIPGKKKKNTYHRVISEQVEMIAVVSNVKKLNKLKSQLGQ